MTNDELKAIKARSEAATPGPWRVNDDGDTVRSPRLDVIADCCPSGVDSAFNLPADSEFIAHARTDVPALVAEVERLTEMLEIALRPERCLCGREMDVAATCSICDNDD